MPATRRATKVFECMLYVLLEDDMMVYGLGSAAGCVNKRYLKGSEKSLIEMPGGKGRESYKVVPNLQDGTDVDARLPMVQTNVP